MAQHLASWNTTIENFPYSPRQFLEATQETIALKKFPKVSFRHVWHGRDTLGRRQYLRVQHRETYIDVGCLFLGGEMMISWVHEADRTRDREARYLGVWIDIQKLFPSLFGHVVPFMEKRQKRLTRDNRTRHHRDDELIFEKLVHRCVLETIDRLGNQRGSRKFRPRYLS